MAFDSQSYHLLSDTIVSGDRGRDILSVRLREGLARAPTADVATDARLWLDDSTRASNRVQHVHFGGPILGVVIVRWLAEATSDLDPLRIPMTLWTVSFSFTGGLVSRCRAHTRPWTSPVRSTYADDIFSYHGDPPFFER